MLENKRNSVERWGDGWGTCGGVVLGQLGKEVER